MTTSDDQKRLSNFYSVLQAKLKPYRDAKQHLDRFLSTDFNVFKGTFEWIKRKEDFLSAIIADLLNPSGSHGQQHKFLNAFLQIIKRPDLKDKKLPKVGPKVQTALGTPDILVAFENFGLVIENKYGAVEQPKQLQRYHEYLNGEYGTDGFCLVYLTPEGDEPKYRGSPERRTDER